MITIRKLSGFNDGLLLRKTERILHEFERDFDFADTSRRYVESLMLLLSERSLLNQTLIADVRRQARGKAGLDAMRRSLNALRHHVITVLGKSPAEWDFFVPDMFEEAPDKRPSTIALYLEDIRSPFNIGSIMRSAAFFDCRAVFVSPGCASPDHPRAVRTSMNAAAIVAGERKSLGELIDQGFVPFVLETGGVPIGDYLFPAKGLAILGSEELGVSPGVLDVAEQHGGRVSIPGCGLKGSLGVSVAAGVLFHTWSRWLRSSSRE